MNKTLIASILITATAATAQADDVGYAAGWLKSAKRGNLENEPPKELDNCSASVEAARKAGKTRLGEDRDFDAFGGKDGYITLDKAEAMCREAIFYRDVVRKDLALFKEFNSMMFAMLNGTNDMTYYQHVIGLADACDKAVDALLAAKLDPSTPFDVGSGAHHATTIGEIKPKLCDAARSDAQRIEKERTDKAAGDRAPFEKVGIKGDKLEFVVKNDGEIFLAGKREPSGPKAYAKASTLFLWTTKEPDIFNYVVHTVYKYVFKGNKLVKESYRTYRLKDGENLGAAAFK